MSRSLLDVNVLLALLDRDHVDHLRARSWLAGAIDDGWASCAITENGFVRIIGQPRYPNPVPPSQAVSLLARATSTELHEFWPCDVSILDESVVDASRLHGHRQITDAYLLALAVRHDGCLATFDTSVVTSAVKGATKDHLVVI